MGPLVFRGLISDYTTRNKSLVSILQLPLTKLVWKEQLLKEYRMMDIHVNLQHRVCV